MTELIDTAEDIKDMDYDDTLNYTQNMRKRLVASITEDGTNMPTKVGTMGVLLQTLNDMDGQVFKRREVDTAGQTGGLIAAQVSSFMLEVAKSLGSNNPLRVEGGGSNVDDYVLPEGDDDFNEFELSQTINHGKTDFDSFTEEFLSRNPEYTDDHTANME